jgi:hypothetical protein
MSSRSSRADAGQVAHRVALFAALAAACSIDFPAPFPTDRGVYSEFLDYEDVEQRLATLATHRTELYLAIRPDDVESGALESVLLAARRHGVPVRAWLLLDDADGYWPGEHNLAAFDAHVRAFWRWNRRAHLGVEWVLVDMEPSLAISNQLAEALASGDLSAAIPVLLANRDGAAFARAQTDWRAAVDAWHDEGMLVAAVGLPYVLDDFGDDDADIQDMFDSPIDGADWDEIGFLVYQNLYGMPDARLGAPLVFDYARTTALRYGARGAIALGTIGSVGKNTDSIGYEDRDALEADLDAAASAGVKKFHLFSLDGMEREGGVGEWIGGLAITPAAPPASDAVAAARAMVALLDG